MTSIPPFFRGYRWALRDVQHTAECYANMQTSPHSIVGALYIAAETSAIELRRLKVDRVTQQKIRMMESVLRSDLATCYGVRLKSDAEVVGYGYRKGFDRALELMTKHAWDMKNPDARMAILEMVMRFERVRFEIASDEDGKIRTLRAREFVV